MNAPTAYGWGSSAPTYSQSYVQPILFDLLRRSGAKRVVDLGCGNGGTVQALSAAGYEVTGCEPDAKGFEIARATCPKSNIYHLGVYDSPEAVAGKPFDAAISTEVIEHLFDPGKLFSFANGVLAPGGTLIVSTPYHGYLKNLALSISGKWDFHLHPQRVGGHIKFWSRMTLCRMFEENGFEVMDFRGAGRFAYFWKSMIVVGRKRSVSNQG